MAFADLDRGEVGDDHAGMGCTMEEEERSTAARPPAAGKDRPMDDWLIWLIFAAVLVVAEICTLTAALGLLGAAAVVTALFAAIGLPLPIQLLVFTAASAAGVLLIRPAALRHLRRPQLERFGVDALIGQQARVLREVTALDGRVRIGGEEWSARAYDETLAIPVGAIVEVMEISGSTALVYPREYSW